MRATLFIALRYLFSKKSRNIINLISFISGLAVFVVSAALVIVLSAFNGLEGLVLEIFNTLDPTIKVVAKEGKSFPDDTLLIENLNNIPGVKSASRVIEENALFMYGEKQYIGKLKAVDPNWAGLDKIEPYMIDGNTGIFQDSLNSCIVGSGIASALGVNPNSFEFLSIYFPKRKKKVDMFEPFRSSFAYPQGIFELQKDFDFTYVIAPLEMGDDVLEMNGNISAIDIEMDGTEGEKELLKKVNALIPNHLVAKDRLNQHALALKVMKSEKLAIFIILAFIFLIASFNIIGALTMLMVEKQKDTMVLRALGASEARVKSIFFWQGAGIVIMGSILGIVMGILICIAQQEFGFVKINSNPGAPPYPIVIKKMDIILILVLIMSIGLSTVWLRVRALRSQDLHLLR
ncbi:MAG TPA: FtsX-like permease family protein [Bacteroidia bacterium]